MKKVSWVLDADIQGFFDTSEHEWLVKFIEHRVADRRVVRLIQKWLRAGVLEDGKRTRSEVGTVQGGSVSPLLANLYLHYIFDLWVQQWRRKRAHGDVVVVRYSDDFIVGFQHRQDAEQFLTELRERFAKFGLRLHPDKTRLIEFGRFTEANCRRRGEGKRSVVLGHIHYYGVPMNSRSLNAFRMAVARLWVAPCSAEASAIVCRGRGCSASLLGGFPLPVSVIPIPGCVLALLPEARAG